MIYLGAVFLLSGACHVAEFLSVKRRCSAVVLGMSFLGRAAVLTEVRRLDSRGAVSGDSRISISSNSQRMRSLQVACFVSASASMSPVALNCRGTL